MPPGSASATAGGHPSTHVPRRPKLRGAGAAPVNTKSDIRALVASTRAAMSAAGVTPPPPPQKAAKVKGPSIVVPDIKERKASPDGGSGSGAGAKEEKGKTGGVITADLDFDVVAGAEGQREERESDEEEEEEGENVRGAYTV